MILNSESFDLNGLHSTSACRLLADWDTQLWGVTATHILRSYKSDSRVWDLSQLQSDWAPLPQRQFQQCLEKKTPQTWLLLVFQNNPYWKGKGGLTSDCLWLFDNGYSVSRWFTYLHGPDCLALDTNIWYAWLPQDMIQWLKQQYAISLISLTAKTNNIC